MSNGRNIKRLLFFVLFTLCYLQGHGQGIRLDVNSESLSTVLIGLRNNYGVQLSFNDQNLSQYKVSADTTFNNAGEAIRFLLLSLPFGYTCSGEVFVIFPVLKKDIVDTYLVAGQVRDRYTLESLPFSHVSVEGKWLVTDFLGKFSYQTQESPPYKIGVSYLGYYLMDTIIYSDNDLILGLTPSNISIKEVVIKGRQVEKSISSGRNSGEIRINHQIAEFLPGNGDNSVFNLLRLQPGITAAGELANDLIIWGSYEGQSRVMFDGFTIFGIKNYNENISAVNPFMAKDIRVLKGGYGAIYGERVGGIVDITGIEGATVAPDVKVTLNNLTLNGYLSVPVGKHNSFSMAFRQTYYDLYQSASLSLLSGQNSAGSGRDIDINVYPDYLFRDVNLKLSGETSGGDNWHLSLFTGSDRYAYVAEDETFINSIYSSSEEKSRQLGGSLFFGKRWARGGVTRATVSYSGLSDHIDDEREVSRLSTGNILYSYDIITETMVDEIDARIEHSLSLPGGHSLEFGGGVIFDQIRFTEDTFSVSMTDNLANASILQGHATDVISIGKRLVLRPGIRVNYPLDLSRLYLQPRLSLTIYAGDNFRINSSAGRYNQFMSLSSILDGTGNYRYVWTLCDNGLVPVLSSNHYVTGISYSWNDFQISAEGYYKTTTGLTRYLITRFNRFTYYGKSRSMGVDFFVKKDFRGHTFWVSYSLGKTEENFTYFSVDEYRRALHDQRHEIKMSGIVNLEPFYLSANWVYGSGFSYPSTIPGEDVVTRPYNRMDISTVYRFSRKNYLFDAGFSLLNLFDTRNIKYSNLTIIPTNQTDPVNIYAEAVPRTLTLFINFSF